MDRISGSLSFRPYQVTASGDLADELLAVVATEGGLEGEQLVEGEAQRVDVGAVIEHAVPCLDLPRARCSHPLPSDPPSSGSLWSLSPGVPHR